MKNKTTFLDFLMILISGGLSFGGLMILAGALISLAEGKESNILVSLFLMAIFGLGPIIGGVFLYKKVKENKNKINESEIEQIILKLAKENKGKITIPELALSASLSLEESKSELDKLQIKGYSRIEVDVDGSIFYEFDVSK